MIDEQKQNQIRNRISGCSISAFRAVRPLLVEGESHQQAIASDEEQHILDNLLLTQNCV